MAIQIRPLSAFKDNYIWVLQHNPSNTIVVVDPGDAQPVLDYLAQTKMQLGAILVTHYHLDHCGGVNDLLKQYQVPIYVSAKESYNFDAIGVKQGDHIILEKLGTKLSVIDIPAHTHGHIAYYSPGMVFCGDTLFTGGCGRLFEGSPADMHKALNKLAALPEDTLVYCGHEYTEANLRFALAVEPGNEALRKRMQQTQAKRAQGLPTVPALLALEKTTNPFLRVSEPEIQQAAEQHAGRKLSTPVEVLQVIREWKDSF